MKILYGVQGTGNGHLTRSRVMAKELAKTDIEVDFLFSGRKKEDYFDMKPFGDATYKKGLTFVVENGKIDLWKTIKNNDYSRLMRDIDLVDTTKYDLVITDFEPITAWAARLQGTHCIGIGHQYAFDHNIPISHDNFVTRFIMKWYAPVKQGIGLHWYHFDQPILPPIIEKKNLPKKVIDNKIVVYLPFEDHTHVYDVLSSFSQYEFHVYGAPQWFIEYHDDFIQPHDGIICHEPSKDGFLKNLSDCNGVICGAGFELVSEAIQLGKRILVKPVEGQMEQHSNAFALVELGLGSMMDVVDFDTIREWLKTEAPKPVKYPNVAKHIVNSLMSGNPHLIDTKTPWNNVVLPNQPEL